MTTLVHRAENERYQAGEEYREDSPLLQDAAAGNEDEESPKTSPTRRNTTRVTPLPRTQLATVYAIKLIVPVANTQVLPYVNKMVAGFDLPSEQTVGYYTGFLSFSHTAGQFLTIYAWGRLSGRSSHLYILREYVSFMITHFRLDRPNTGYRRGDDGTGNLYPRFWRITQFHICTHM